MKKILLVLAVIILLGSVGCATAPKTSSNSQPMYSDAETNFPQIEKWRVVERIPISFKEDNPWWKFWKPNKIILTVGEQVFVKDHLSETVGVFYSDATEGTIVLKCIENGICQIRQKDKWVAVFDSTMKLGSVYAQKTETNGPWTLKQKELCGMIFTLSNSSEKFSVVLKSDECKECDGWVYP